LKGFCPEIFNFLLVEVFCPDELFDFLPEIGVCPGYMIFFPTRKKASAGDIISFLPAEKASARKHYFISCPWEDVCSDIFLFTARGKTSPGDIIFMFCPLKGFCPEGLFSFLPLEWLLPVSLSLSLSPRIKFLPRRWGVGVGLPDVVARFRSFLCVAAVQKQLSWWCVI
jgi:hypothetical protein